ncbi:MAG TPA: MerR family transcriptional regulator [Solirubrobacteraceae bacterium]
MSGALVGEALRIGELARRVGTTPRTIRYYEELGLLSGSAQRPAGGHRLYAEEDVDHLRELIRLRELLGLTLEELGAVVQAEEARAMLRAEFFGGVADPQRVREILTEARGHLDLQLSLVHRRQAELAALEGELRERHDRVLERLAEADER